MILRKQAVLITFNNKLLYETTATGTDMKAGETISGKLFSPRAERFATFHLSTVVFPVSLDILALDRFQLGILDMSSVLLTLFE